MMKDNRHEKLKFSNDLLDAMLVGVKTQDDLWGKEGIITQLNKALLERILNAEMDFHLENTNEEQPRQHRAVHSKRQTQHFRASDYS